MFPRAAPPRARERLSPHPPNPCRCELPFLYQYFFHFLATRSSCTSLAESYHCCNHGARCTGMPCARGPSVVCTLLVVVPSFGGANAVGSGTAAD